MAAPVEGMSSDEPSWTLSEVVRSYVAIFVVTFSLLFILIAWAARGIEDAERIATMLAGVLGLVIGYYFGKEGVDQARAAAEQAQTTAGQAVELKDLAANLAGEADDDLRRELETRGTRLAEYASLLEEARKHPERKVKDLLEDFYGKET